MKKFRLKIGVDVDDVLFSCNQYAFDLANKEYNYNPPLHLNEVFKWGKSGNRTDIMFEYFAKESFYKNQPVLDGAKEFIKELSKRAEVFIITAVSPQFMGIRGQRLIEAFPEIKPENIIMGSRKDLVSLDMLLDDGGHNIIATQATYPVLFRRPWNRDLTGLLSVNNYNEFLEIVDQVISGYVPQDYSKVRIINLVGPTGSNKTQIADTLALEDGFIRPNSCTTKVDAGKGYYPISFDEFYARQERGDFIETTMYGGNAYGLEKEEIETLFKETDKCIVMPMDICGAIALKSLYKDKVLNVFIKKDKKSVMHSILLKKYSTEEKLNRLLSLDDEYKNEDLCDEAIDNNGSFSEAVEKIKEIIKGE